MAAAEDTGADFMHRIMHRIMDGIMVDPMGVAHITAGPTEEDGITQGHPTL